MIYIYDTLYISYMMCIYIYMIHLLSIYDTYYIYI